MSYFGQEKKRSLGHCEHPFFQRRIWRFGEIASCLDTAMRLAELGWFAPWDSVQATSQTAGRGQLRRRWHSPPGNVYAALRLPLTPPFATTAAAPAVAALLAGGLAEVGWSVRIKWPNDLVLVSPAGEVRKVGGILLEERGGVLVAGVGINVLCPPSPDFLRKGCAMRATSLAEADFSGRLPLAEELWPLLVNCAFSAYDAYSSSALYWKTHAESMLLWRHEQVELREGSHRVCGTLEGLTEEGGLHLSSGWREQEFLSGSLYPCP